EVVEHVVEQVARALREEGLAEVLVVLAAAEETGHRQQLDVWERDQEVGPEEDVELGGIQPLDRLVVGGEVEDEEQILGVLVDLRALAFGKDVLESEGMPAEALGELTGLDRVRRWQVDPGETAGAELSEPGLGRRDGL